MLASAIVSPLAPPSSMTPYRSTPPLHPITSSSSSSSSSPYSRRGGATQQSKTASARAIEISCLPGYLPFHAHTRVPFPSQPLLSAPSIALHALLVDCPPVTRSASLRERDCDREKHRRATLPPPLPREQPMRDDQDNVPAAPQAPCLFTIHAFFDRIRTIGDDMIKSTPCLGRYHGMTLHDKLCARCHPEVRVPFSRRTLSLTSILR